MPRSVSPTPMNVKFELGKRPEEQTLPDALSVVHPPPRQLPPLKHQVTLPDLLYKEKTVTQKNLKKAEVKPQRKLQERVHDALGGRLSLNVG